MPQIDILPLLKEGEDVNLWQAIDLDFGLTVLADACLDADPEVHRMLTEKLFPQWADVLAVEDWIKAIAPQ